MLPNTALPTLSVLFIDGYHRDRRYYADQLKHCSHFQILEAADAQSGLTHYRSQQIDCVVLELDLPDTSGFRVLTDLIPLPRRPNVAVIILTRISTHPSFALELAKKKGAYDCFLKTHTSPEDLDRAIRRAVALVELIPQEDYKIAS
jgi:DNA-binding NarL/FixJ family response regulator